MLCLMNATLVFRILTTFVSAASEMVHSDERSSLLTGASDERSFVNLRF